MKAEGRTSKGGVRIIIIKEQGVKKAFGIFFFVTGYAVMVGTVGFILIMAGRTGWDLLVYLGGFAIDDRPVRDQDPL